MKLKIAFIIMSISLLTKLSIGNENKKQTQFNEILNKYLLNLNKAGTDYIESFYHKSAMSLMNYNTYGYTPLFKETNLNDFKIIQKINHHYNKKINNLLKDGKIENWVGRIIKSNFTDFSDKATLIIEPTWASFGDLDFKIRLINNTITRKHPLHKKLKGYNKGDKVVFLATIKPYNYYDIMNKEMKAKYKSWLFNTGKTKDWLYKSILVNYDMGKITFLLNMDLNLKSIKKLN